MFVYRIEGPTGKGFFAGGFSDTYCAAVDFKHLPNEMPCPVSPQESTSDLGGYAKKVRRYNFFAAEMLFGCSSIRQLRQWVKFAKGRRAIEKEGCRFVKYKVEKQHVIRGHFQVVFNKKHAQKICELDATTLKEAA